MSRTSSSTARWVVIPPILQQAACRVAVAKAVEAAGLRLHDLDASPDNPPFNESSVVILTSDASLAVQAGVAADAVAGLLVGYGVRNLPEGSPDELPQDIKAATALIGRIGLLPAERIFRSEDFASGPVEILRGLQISLPAVSASSSLSPHAKALRQAVAMLDPAHPRAIWAPELFSRNSRLISGGASSQFDLTGRPRFLISGPYIVMPAGRWRATYQLTFDQRGSRPRFRVDWGGVEDYVADEFVPGRAGVFQISQEYQWDEPGPAELRIMVMEGVFEGCMTFSGAEIVRID